LNLGEVIVKRILLLAVMIFGIILFIVLFNQNSSAETLEVENIKIFISKELVGTYEKGSQEINEMKSKLEEVVYSSTVFNKQPALPALEIETIEDYINNNLDNFVIVELTNPLTLFDNKLYSTLIISDADLIIFTDKHYTEYKAAGLFEKTLDNNFFNKSFYQ
jgi:hypothetical protein